MEKKMKIKEQLLTILMVLVLIPVGIFSQDQKVPVNPDVKKAASSIIRVEAKYVCMGMGTNRLFERELIPAVVDGKTYYGCCEGCQSKLLKDPQMRSAIDPINGAVVDKATAVIGALLNGVVHYFETEETMGQFAKLIQTKK